MEIRLIALLLLVNAAVIFVAGMRQKRSKNQNRWWSRGWERRVALASLLEASATGIGVLLQLRWNYFE